MSNGNKKQMEITKNRSPPGARIGDRMKSETRRLNKLTRRKQKRSETIQAHNRSRRDNRPSRANPRTEIPRRANRR